MAYKRKSDALGADDEISGYPHDVTDLKVSKTNHRYFNAQFQNKDEFHHLVCFSPEKQETYKNAAHMKSPVKLSGVMKTPSKFRKNLLDITARKHTSLQILDAKNINFNRRNLVIKETPDIELKDIDRTSNEQVTINIKVLGHATEVEEMEIYSRRTKKQEFIVADHTKGLQIIVWADHIKALKKDEFFKITNLSIRLKNDKIKLTTSPKTQIMPIAPLENISEELDIDLQEELTGTVKQIRIEKQLICGACNKAMNEETMNKKTTKCTSCNMTQLNNDVKKNLLVHMNVKTEDNITKLVIFDSALELFLGSVNKLGLLSSTEELEEFFLGQEINVQYESDVVTNIKTLKDPAD